MDSVKTIEVDCLKLENFDGTNFNAWHHEIIFGIQLLKIYHVISEENPTLKRTETFWCRSYLLNCLVDHLIYIYSNKPSATKDI